MKQNDRTRQSFNENQSIEVIKEMIMVSQRKLKNDGILFILWGWVMFIHYLIMFVVRRYPSRFNSVLNNIPFVLTLAALAFTLIYLYKQRKKVQTYIGISLRYVWISMVICMVLVNLIQYNVLHKIIFELQHPIFMVIVAFAIVTTGGILRYNLIIIGGIIFAVLALISSYLALPEQLLLEAIAWLLAFIIPGHLLYSKRKM